MSESNRYSRGKIYKIHRDDCEEIYIGGTTRATLAQRLSEHVRGTKHYKNCASSSLVDRPGYTITLLELYPCGSKDELQARKQHYIETTANVINMRKAFTGLDKTEYRQQWHQEHKEGQNERRRQWHQDHKESNNQRCHQRYQKHKEQLAIERSIKVTCECGRVVVQGALWKHKKSKKHQSLLEAKATEQ